jgi:hypothetical protein
MFAYRNIAVYKHKKVLFHFQIFSFCFSLNQIRLKFDLRKRVGADSAFIYYLLFWLRLRFEIAFYL